MKEENIELANTISKIGGVIYKTLSIKNGLNEITKRKDQIINLLTHKLDVSYQLRTHIVMPKTQSIKSVIEDEYAAKFDYEGETKADDIIKLIQYKDIITKYQCENYLDAVLSILFSKEFTIRPVNFDCIVIQYFTIPILIGKNKIAQGNRFSLFLELNSWRESLVDNSSKLVTSMLIEEYNQLRHQEKRNKESFFTKYSSQISIGITIVLGITNILLLRKKSN